MHLLNSSPSLLSLLLLLSSTTPTTATPFAREALRHLGFSWLEDRSTCDSYCGAQSQYCCVSGEACYTNAANVAYCSAGSNTGAGYGLYTTTWTETDTITRTSTGTSYYAGATSAVVTAGTPAICTTSLGQSSCGTICCASDQRCAYAGSCTGYTSTYIAPATSYSAPVRPTSSGGVSTATTVASITTTQTFLPAASASGSSFPIVSASSSNGLSGGAIAGIVIGVIAGIILLLLICFCCIVRAGWSAFLAIFGLGGKKDRRTERTEIVQERYSRHGTAAGGSRRNEHSTWYGGSKPARVDEKRKKESGIGGLGMVGAGLIGLAAVLGLKRSADKKKSTGARTERSDISSSYYTDSYTGTSASSASSDRRTRRTSDTRGTRR